MEQISLQQDNDPGEALAVMQIQITLKKEYPSSSAPSRLDLLGMAEGEKGGETHESQHEAMPDLHRTACRLAQVANLWAR